MKPTFTTNDWQKLRDLRQRFLSDASKNYWKESRDLELYDQVYAERIGWKWRAVLEKLSLAGWQSHAENILDWGCGTGIASGTVAAWSGIKKISLVDQSPLALAFAQKKLLEGKINATFFEKEKPLEPSTLMLISHVVSELTEKELLELATKAATADEVIWVEPGSHELSRRLSNLREIFIQAGHHIIAPCVHQHPCPILKPENKNHWCHFFARPPIEIFQSAFWHEASRELGIDLRSLPYSYFACSRSWKPKWPILITNKNQNFSTLNLLSLARRKSEALCKHNASSDNEARDNKGKQKNLISIRDEYNTNAERLIGHPRALKGHCKLLCCGASGLQERTLQKRDQPALFRGIVKKEIDGVFSWKINCGKQNMISDGCLL